MKYSKGYKYKTESTEEFQTKIIGQGARIVDAEGKLYAELLPNGTLRSHVSYSWDGASGPTVDTENTMVPSLVHDILYQMEREGHLAQETRELADETLHDLLRKCGMSWLRARLWLWAVRNFAASSATRRDAKDGIYEAKNP